MAGRWHTNVSLRHALHKIPLTQVCSPSLFNFAILSVASNIIRRTFNQPPGVRQYWEADMKMNSTFADAIVNAQWPACCVF